MRWTSLAMLVALGCGRHEDSGPSPWAVRLPRRTDRLGDRYEIELRSRSTAADESVGGDTLSATMRYTDEVLAVEDGRATRVRRTFRSDKGAEPATEVDVRAGRGLGDGKRTDHFRQFERLVPAAIPDLSSRGFVDAAWRCDGALGAPPSSVLDIPDAAWLDSRCTCTPRREIVIDGRHTVEFEVRISFDGDTGPARLDGALRFDPEEGLLREVHLRGSTATRSYELHATQAVTPAGSAR